MGEAGRSSRPSRETGLLFGLTFPVHPNPHFPQVSLPSTRDEPDGPGVYKLVQNTEPAPYRAHLHVGTHARVSMDSIASQRPLLNNVLTITVNRRKCKSFALHSNPVHHTVLVVDQEQFVTIVDNGNECLLETIILLRSCPRTLVNHYRFWFTLPIAGHWPYLTGDLLACLHIEFD